MKILFLTDNFPPEVNAPASRTYEHSREWVLTGHEVTVITCFPNFPTGKIFPGYKNRFWMIERLNGIKVIRVWTYVSANEGFFRRTLDYVSFMISAVVAGLFVRSHDIIIGTSPQFFTVCAACVLGKLKQLPWIFELRDLWPESIRAVGAIRNKQVISLLELIEVFLYRQSKAIISVTESFKRSLAARGIPSEKIKVVTNGVDLSNFYPRQKDIELLKELKLDKKFVVGYIGTHGLAHALDTILDAAKIIQRNDSAKKFSFLFLGNGAQKQHLVDRASKENIENVVFVSSVSKDLVVRYWSLLDISIIHLRRDPTFLEVIPSKLFESMGMGIPVLHGVEGESAEIVRNNSIGLTFESENSDSFCKALLELAENKNLLESMKLSGPVAAAKFERKKLARDMMDYIERVEHK